MLVSFSRKRTICSTTRLPMMGMPLTSWPLSSVISKLQLQSDLVVQMDARCSAHFQSKIDVLGSGIAGERARWAKPERSSRSA